VFVHVYKSIAYAKKLVIYAK